MYNKINNDNYSVCVDPLEAAINKRVNFKHPRCREVDEHHFRGVEKLAIAGDLLEVCRLYRRQRLELDDNLVVDKEICTNHPNLHLIVHNRHDLLTLALVSALENVHHDCLLVYVLGVSGFERRVYVARDALYALVCHFRHGGGGGDREDARGRLRVDVHLGAGSSRIIIELAQRTVHAR